MSSSRLGSGARSDRLHLWAGHKMRDACPGGRALGGRYARGTAFAARRGGPSTASLQTEVSDRSRYALLAIITTLTLIGLAEREPFSLVRLPVQDTHA